MEQNERTRYVVREAKEEATGITTLSLTDMSGAVPSFNPGQFVNVFFPETNTPEGKAYSISSPPEEDCAFSITVRAIGEFSNRLCAMKPGDTIHASLPYGFFRPEYDDSDLVLLASGIGVTPFRSILLHAARTNQKRRITLLHSVRTASDALFRSEFETLKQSHPHLALSYFVTRENVPSVVGLARRMTAADALNHVPSRRGSEFLICGSIPFTRDMWRALRQEGVSEDSLYTEAFFSH